MTALGALFRSQALLPGRLPGAKAWHPLLRQRPLRTFGQLRDLLEHEADEGDEVEVGKGAGIPCVVLRQPAIAGGPGKGSLDHPAPRQQHEATLGVWQLTASGTMPGALAA